MNLRHDSFLSPERNDQGSPTHATPSRPGGPMSRKRRNAPWLECRSPHRPPTTSSTRRSTPAPSEDRSSPSSSSSRTRCTGSVLHPVRPGQTLLFGTPLSAATPIDLEAVALFSATPLHALRSPGLPRLDAGPLDGVPREAAHVGHPGALRRHGGRRAPADLPDRPRPGTDPGLHPGLDHQPGHGRGDGRLPPPRTHRRGGRPARQARGWRTTTYDALHGVDRTRCGSHPSWSGGSSRRARGRARLSLPRLPPARGRCAPARPAGAPG